MNNNRSEIYRPLHLSASERRYRRINNRNESTIDRISTTYFKFQNPKYSERENRIFRP